jgi:hypothetical protein
VVLLVLTDGIATGAKWGAKVLQWLGRMGTKILKYGSKGVRLAQKGMMKGWKGVKKGLIKGWKKTRSAFSKVKKLAREITPDTIKHIFEGEIKAGKKGIKATGCHHIDAIRNGKAKITGITKKPNNKGIYEATVEILDQSSGTWIPKKGISTFFPDNWSKTEVLEAITEAFQDSKKIVKGDYWEGMSKSGIKTGGYLDTNGNIATAYPIL